MTVFQGKVPELGSCGSCGAILRLDSFRHRDALRAFTEGVGTCQLCQDLTSAGIESTQALCHGAVVGSSVDKRNEADFTDIAFLPFRYCASTLWYEWEPRFLFRFAHNPPPVDHWYELVPMAEHWLEHQVRVRCYRRGDDPALLGQFAELDLLVAPDSRRVDAAVDRFSELSRISRLPLSTVLQSTHDFPLPPLRSLAWMEGMLPYVPASDEPSSSLRTCALLAAVLDRGFASSSVRPMDVVLRWSMAQDETGELEAAS